MQILPESSIFLAGIGFGRRLFTVGLARRQHIDGGIRRMAFQRCSGIERTTFLVIDVVLTVGISAVLFALLFKYVPPHSISWHGLMYG